MDCLAHNQKQLAQLRQEVQIQLNRLKQEVDNHNASRALLVQTQTNARYWEHQAMSWQAQVHLLESKVCAAEHRCQDLSADNERLQSVTKHMVRVPTTYHCSENKTDFSRHLDLLYRPYRGEKSRRALDSTARLEEIFREPSTKVSFQLSRRKL